MKPVRRVKIVATLGPASNDIETIGAMIMAGVDVFRINMSHSDHTVLSTLTAAIRTAAASLERNVAVLADLQGPKIRIGLVKGGEVAVIAGSTIKLVSTPCEGDNQSVHLPHPEIFAAAKRGDRLLVDDGKLLLRIEHCSFETLEARVEVGGALRSRKGVSLPDTDLAIGAMTEKDKADLQAALVSEVDWVALSFVQRAEDLRDMRRIVRGRAGIISKIEKPQALRELEDIIALSDAVMVARGDLGVELPLETVPGLQKRIIRLSRAEGRPVIVATQMLESMIDAPVPTRAEVSDVSSAIGEGADAIMLSAESAAGRYPVQSVEMMARIASAAEQQVSARYEPVVTRTTTPDAIAAASRQIAETVSAACITAYTTSGATANLIARERPPQPIVALSPNAKTVGRLALTWGVTAILAEAPRSTDDLEAYAGEQTLRTGLANAGDRFVLAAGLPMNMPGSTNLLKLSFA